MGLHFSRIPALILVAALVALCVKGFVVDLAVVEGDSMLPRYRPGDVVLVLRCAYGIKAPLGLPGGYLVTWARPALGDVVAAANPVDGHPVIKRVAALGPQRLTVQGDRLLGKDLDLALEAGEAAVLGQALTLPEGTIFVLGDNLRASLDSRSYGPLELRAVAGRVLGGPLFGPRPPRGGRQARRRRVR